MAEIKRNTLGQQILEAVLDIIEKNGYKKGDKLPTEKELSEKLGVGRNSLREAMKSLSISGAVQSLAGKGTFLLKEPSDIRGENISDAVSEASTLEILQARMIIETEAAVLAAQNGVSEKSKLQNFEKTLLELEKSLDEKRESASDDNFKYHVELVKLCGNRFLCKMHHSIIKDIQNSRRILTIEFSNAEFEKSVHRKIFEAIKERDAQKTRCAMKEHFENTIAYCKRLYHKNK